MVRAVDVKLVRQGKVRYGLFKLQKQVLITNYKYIIYINFRRDR